MTELKSRCKLPRTRSHTLFLSTRASAQGASHCVAFIAFSLEMDFLFCEMMCKRQTTDRRSRKSKNFKQTQEKEEEKKKGKKYTRDKKATRFISTISLCTPHKTTRVTHKPAKRRQRRRIRRDENATKDDDDDDGVLFSRAGVWASFSFLFLLLFLFPLVLCFCV